MKEVSKKLTKKTNLDGQFVVINDNWYALMKLDSVAPGIQPMMRIDLKGTVTEIKN